MALTEVGTGMLEERINRFLEAAEQLRLSDYIAFASDRKRRLFDAFWQGVARGLGIMVGFSILGAVVLFILQDLAKRNLPGISDFVAQVAALVQLKLQ